MRRVLRKIGRLLAPLALGLVAAAGCYPSSQGAEPDDRAPYFPTGVGVSPSGKWLFLVNSNFDLRFNAGTVQAFSLDALEPRIRACAEIKRNTGLLPPNCEQSEARDFVRAAVRIGAFAADLQVTELVDREAQPLPNKGRMLIPVRGDASVTAIDWEEHDDGRITLRCGPGAAPNQLGAKCAAEWRLGTDPAKSSRGLALEGEPFTLTTARYVSAPLPDKSVRRDVIAAVVHQSSGNVSLLVNAGLEASPPQAKLAFVLGNLAQGGTGIAALDSAPAGSSEPSFPRFLVSNRSQSNLLVVQYFPDPIPERSALVLADVIPIPPQASGHDSRGVVVDPPNPGETRPTRVFLTNRTPAALVLGEVDARTRRLAFYDNVPLPIGPSRITRGVVDGKTRIFALSFDARTLVVYDPDGRRVSNVVRLHRGPHALAHDAKRKLLYVANFTDSTVQVIDLDPANAGSAGKPGSFEQVVFSIGVPSAPRR